jgi:hypothetical protein
MKKEGPRVWREPPDNGPGVCLDQAWLLYLIVTLTGVEAIPLATT